MIFRKPIAIYGRKLFLDTLKFVGVSGGKRIPSNRSIFKF
jgi:hypothetical protein